jgi:hypothetical protein
MNDDASKKAEDKELCPLFMEGLPRDFASNPQLAAIASLLEETDDQSDKEVDRRANKNFQVPKTVPVITRAGGGKVQRMKRRTQTSPYPKQTKRKASLGEAQLFLNMWKI